jgi:hypothetical protein
MSKIASFAAWLISIYAFLTFIATAVWYMRSFVNEKPFPVFGLIAVLLIIHSVLAFVLSKIDGFGDNPFWEPVIRASRVAKKFCRWIFYILVINCLFAVLTLFIIVVGNREVLYIRMFLNLLMLGSVYIFVRYAIGVEAIKFWLPITSDLDELDKLENKLKEKE